jgi:hypothetical protein
VSGEYAMLLEFDVFEFGTTLNMRPDLVEFRLNFNNLSWETLGNFHKDLQ